MPEILDLLRGFQSTPPSRGATNHAGAGAHPAGDFNPRPPRGGRQKSVSPGAQAWRFQSTPPSRGATIQKNPGTSLCSISIHAPLAGGDQRTPEWALVYSNFNPRPPRGGRQLSGRTSGSWRDFNPRPPRGGRPARAIWFISITQIISIHAPLAGGDVLISSESRLLNPISIHAPLAGGDKIVAFFVSGKI